MALDLHLLDKTISKVEILFTLRFYYWEGDWISLGYHQKSIPLHWRKLKEEGDIKIVRRPTGGGAVLHSGGITYALTFKKSYYKTFSYELVNNWLIESFKKLGLSLERGHERKSLIKVLLPSFINFLDIRFKDASTGSGPLSTCIVYPLLKSFSFFV